MQARVFVTLKQGVLDPQGTTIRTALTALGHDGVREVRQGKLFDIALEAESRADAEAELKTICESLLANMVIENYHVEIIE